MFMCTSVWMKACEYARGAQGRELAGAFLLCFCVCTFMCIDVWIDTHACIREAQRAGTLGGTRVLLAVLCVRIYALCACTQHARNMHTTCTHAHMVRTCMRTLQVKLAAEMVLESVQREAAVYLKMLHKDPRRRKKKETARPP